MSHRTIIITLSIFFFVTSLQLLKTVKYSSDIPQKVLVLFVFLNLTSSSSYPCQYLNAIFLDKQLSWSTTFIVHKYITGKHTCMQHTGVRTHVHTHTHTHTLKYIKTSQRRRHRTFIVVHRKKKGFLPKQ